MGEAAAAGDTIVAVGFAPWMGLGQKGRLWWPPPLTCVVGAADLGGDALEWLNCRVRPFLSGL